MAVTSLRTLSVTTKALAEPATPKVAVDAPEFEALIDIGYGAPLATGPVIAALVRVKSANGSTQSRVVEFTLFARFVSGTATGGTTSTGNTTASAGTAVSVLEIGISKNTLPPEFKLAAVQLTTVPDTAFTVPAPEFTQPAGNTPMVKPAGMAVRTSEPGASKNPLFMPVMRTTGVSVVASLLLTGEGENKPTVARKSAPGVMLILTGVPD
jgi:hypothetical protein